MLFGFRNVYLPPQEVDTLFVAIVPVQLKVKEKTKAVALPHLPVPFMLHSYFALGRCLPIERGFWIACSISFSMRCCS
jgi:hypothetical protein